MVHIVGAGPGATDLITVRGARLLKEADVIIYAGSLVNKELLELAKEGAEVYDSARMTLEGDGGDKKGLEGKKGDPAPSYRGSLHLWGDQRADGRHG